MFQFIKNTRVSVLTLQFDEKIYTGKLRDPIFQVLEQKQLECVEVYGANIPDILLDFASMVARHKRYCYFTSLSIMGYHNNPNASLPNGSAMKIAAMLQHFKLRIFSNFSTYPL